MEQKSGGINKMEIEKYWNDNVYRSYIFYKEKGQKIWEGIFSMQYVLYGEKTTNIGTIGTLRVFYNILKNVFRYFSLNSLYYRYITKLQYFQYSHFYKERKILEGIFPFQYLFNSYGEKYMGMIKVVIPILQRYFCYRVQQERIMLCKIKATGEFGGVFYD